MDLKILSAVTVVAIATLQSKGVASQFMINDCYSFRDVYETFSSCAIFAMYNTTDRNTLLFDKDVLEKDDLIDVVNYWCSLLAKASSCTVGGALQCSNRVQISSVVSHTGGACKNGMLREEYKTLIPSSFRYNTRCLSQSLDITEVCETLIPEKETDVSIEAGVLKMTSIVKDVLDCNNKQLGSFAGECGGSRESVLFFTLRSLTFSVPHALGVDLSVPTVMDIMNEN